jgi:hypothetical protein
VATQVQIQPVSASCWQVTRVLELRTRVYKYDIVARIVLDEDDKRYYVELAGWDDDDARSWQRLARGYQLFDGAERWASDYALGKVKGS